uniref:Cadherin-5 n=1 Tax=Cyprinus carpio TaxID=7962 RepID=A0A8C2L5C5_CYPCA
KKNKGGHFSRFILSGEGANDMFTVNEYGDISVNAMLDWEKKSVYKLSASLIDSKSGKPLDKDNTLVIVVLDINDNSPVFPPDLSGSISESSKAGSIVMTVNATDADDGSTQNGRIEYKLLNGTDLFNINNERVIRTLKSSLDREKQSQYIIAIKAKDMPGMENGNSATTTVTININDVNDNIATFKKGKYQFNVKEDSKLGTEIGILGVEDKDEIQNKNPIFTIQNEFDKVFDIKLNYEKDGILSLKVPLDYETNNMYKFYVNVDEHTESKSPDNQGPDLQKRAEVSIHVIDVDEPPVFSKTEYNFNISEGPISSPYFGAVSAKDPDNTGYKIRYSIEDANCPVAVDPVQGHLSLKRQLDREQQSLHTFKVTAHEDVPNGLKSYALVNLKVLDINDNAPELINGNLHVCENDTAGTIIGTVGAYDKDESSKRFRFTLAKNSSNFSLHDNEMTTTASIELKQGGFSTERSMKYVLEIEISDGGTPEQKSINLVQIKVCTAYAQTRMSVSALLAILLCIITILGTFTHISYLTCFSSFCYKDIHARIHDLMVVLFNDTHGHIFLSSFSHCHPHRVAKVLGMMIEVKKDEADHDRDGIPYDTLHIYGYEGSESLAGSLSSLDSSSSGSNLDYDFLHEWGPRFRTLAQLFGVDGSDTDSSD